MYMYTRECEFRKKKYITIISIEIFENLKFYCDILVINENWSKMSL